MVSSRFFSFLLILIIYIFPVHCETDQWLLSGRADPKSLIHVTLALKQVNPEWLDETLIVVSDPDSPRYGQHMNLEEVVQHVHGDPAGVQKIRKLFKAHSVQPQFTKGEGFARADMPVSTAEQLFSAQFYLYQHRDNSSLTVIRTPSYTLPQTIKPYVDFACCFDKFPTLSGRSSMQSYTTVSSRPSSPFSSVTPSSILSTYKIKNYQATNSSTTQGVAGFIKQYFDPSDLTMFQKEFDVPSNPVVKIIGKNDHMSPGGEATLDIEYMTAVGQKVSTWFVSVEGTFLDWLILLINTSHVPLVHSVSYGESEDPAGSSFMFRCEQEFKKLGIMGITILFASGDEGVNCRQKSEDAKFQPEWPASSPSITTVGGTTTTIEEVWSQGGGGFSNVFSTPEYQAETVKDWLKSGETPPVKYFNASGRAYPDISAYAVNFEFVFKGEKKTDDGTSCSTPTAAGLISLLNDVRLNSGKSSLGFLNPLLYKKLGMSGFFDTIKGKNSGLDHQCPGFTAIKGWDPASGWGSPNFELLKELI